MNEEYFLWTKGSIYNGCIYSVSLDRGFSTYTFYTGFKANQTASEHQLSATIKFPTNAPVSDDDISNAFVESLSKKMYLDITNDSKEYIECLKTLPRGFFTQTNMEKVLENVVKKTMNADEETIKKSDTACCDLMEYAHEQNHHVRKGTGREHIGE